MYFGNCGNTKHSGVITVVADVHNDTLRCGIACCSPRDHFIKQKGRTIATGRLEKEKILQVPFTNNYRQKILELLRDNSPTKWVKRLCTHLLQQYTTNYCPIKKDTIRKVKNT